MKTNICINEQESQTNIIEILQKLSVKFYSANYLIKAINKFGLFNGTVKVDGDNLTFIKEYKKTSVYTQYSLMKDCNWYYFRCKKTDDLWICILFECYHSVYLVFEIKTGNIKRIVPDSDTKSRLSFWKYKTRQARRKELLDLINKKGAENV